MPTCENPAMLKLVRLLAAVAVAASLAACGGVNSPSTQATEDLSGTLDPQGQSFKTFSVSKTGEMQLTLQSLTPRPVIGFVSLAVGTPSGSICSPLLGYIVSQAAVGTPYSFPTIVKGSYCVIIADSNAILPAQVSWAIRLSHP